MTIKTFIKQEEWIITKSKLDMKQVYNLKLKEKINMRNSFIKGRD